MNMAGTRILQIKSDVLDTLRHNTFGYFEASGHHSPCVPGCQLGPPGFFWSGPLGHLVIGVIIYTK